MPKRTEEFKRTKGCIIKHFAFCYNNRCPVYEEVKYGVSYWLQELSPEQFKDTEEEDEPNRLYYRKDNVVHHQASHTTERATPKSYQKSRFLI